jgi:uncharacterized phosphosugar-binding protein
MSSLFIPKVVSILNQLEKQDAVFDKASTAMAESLVTKHAVYFYGSGHSTLPCLDVFPRYGSYVGLQPIHDPRLLWFNILGPGGVRELLWLERTEGYVMNVLKSYPIGKGDTVVVYSHGGVNAAPVEAALACHDLGATVVGVTTLDQIDKRKAAHSSGKRLADIADFAIDTGAPARDALVDVDGSSRPVAASSTVLSVAITMELIARTATIAAQKGLKLDVFASPASGDTDGNDQIFASYGEFKHRLGVHDR